MAETPKTREELVDAIIRLRSGNCASEDFLEAIESLGLRIVPADPTDEMISQFDWLIKQQGCGVTESLIEAIAKSPFAPEDPNG